jgi:3,4-dihydroxy 2-butanone 4-phosphate synthase/GTP cyclohydrolase II
LERDPSQVSRPRIGRALSGLWLTLRQNPKTLPGHIFPLIARPEGVLRRAGHTEAAVDLMRLARLTPVAVIVEIMNEDGSMARLPQLRKLADHWGLPLITIKDLIAYRLRSETTIIKEVIVDMPTKYGHFQLHAYRHKITGEPHIALVKGTWSPDEPLLVRVHSSCFTGDILGSLRCDCGNQLALALQKIEAEGKGPWATSPTNATTGRARRSCGT